MSAGRTPATAALLLAAACADGDAPGTAPPEVPAAQPWLEEVAAAAGISFVHRSGHEPDRFLIPEIVAGGVALLDADDDGRLDVYLVQSGTLTPGAAEGPGNALFRNTGGMRFADVSAASGADDRGYGMGVATGDADGDGRTDLYVTNVGPNRLLRNLGDMRFRDVSADAGVGDPGVGSSAAFFDPDADGDLDLFVANYLAWSVETEMQCSNALGQRDYCAPTVYASPAVDVLYENAGDGTFHDATRTAGLTAASGTGLGVVCGDFTGDGRADVFVANDGRPNHLWVNLGALRFEDRAFQLGCAMDLDAIAKAGMGVAAEDVDGDGDLDLLVSNLRRESDSLYLNSAKGFVDATAAAGLGVTSRAFTRFGTGLADLDCDGWLDLYQANGRIGMEAQGHGSDDPFAEPNLLYRGEPGGRFAEVSPRGGTRMPLVHTSRGAAFGDLDDDGGIDVVVANRDAAPYVLRNVVPRRGHWLVVRVLDEHGRDALGATATLRLADRALRRDVRTAYSYCSASDPRVHFGLGTAARVEGLDVRWIDGTVETFPVDGVDCALVVRRVRR